MAIARPSIVQAPLGPQTQPRMARHDIICVHTMVGYLVSTDTFFRVSNGAGYSGTESQYGIGGKWGPDLGGGWDGRIWQWQDLLHTADANYQGNPRVISVETADNAPARPEDIAAWTPAQLDGLIDLIAWLCTPEAHAGCPHDWECYHTGIPAQLVPDTQSFRRGLAYHAQGAAEHTVGEWWSTSHDKPCPAARRIAQFRQLVVPGVQRRLAGADEEDDMAADPQVLDLLQSIAEQSKRTADNVEKIYLYGVRAVDAAGNPAPTQVNNSLRGVVGQLVDANAKLGVLVQQTAPAASTDPTDPAPAPSSGS